MNINSIAAFLLTQLLSLSMFPFKAAACSPEVKKQIAVTSETEPIPARVTDARIPRLKGVGLVHESVSTNSRNAQAYYDQGLTFLLSYDWIRAARSFHESLRADPNLAMAYMGLGFALTGLADPHGVHVAERAAENLAPMASKREQLRIRLREMQLRAMADPDARPEYIKALDSALISFPNDVVFLLLRGNAAEGFAAGMGQRGGAESIRYYEQVLRLSPNDFAGHHFLVHSYELLGEVPEAIREAEMYVKLAPAVSHAHHMLGHDLRRVGRLQEAIAEFEMAMRMEEALYREEPDTLVYDWHYPHNLVLLASAYRQAGRLQAAEKTLAKLADLPVRTVADAVYQKVLPVFLLQTGRSDEATKAAQPMFGSPFPIARAIGHAVAGNALALNGKIEPARAELQSAEQELSSADPIMRPLAQEWIEILRMQISSPKMTGNSVQEAFKNLELRMLHTPGSDAWSDNVFMLEFIFSIAIQRRDWELGKFTAAQMQKHAPDYGGTHFALYKLAEHEGKLLDAKRELKTAKAAWNGSLPSTYESFH